MNFSTARLRCIGIDAGNEQEIVAMVVVLMQRTSGEALQ
jgi:hypothetical protein